MTLIGARVKTYPNVGRNTAFRQAYVFSGADNNILNIMPVQEI